VLEVLVDEAGEGTVGILAQTKRSFNVWLPDEPESVRAWIAANHYTGDAGTTLLIPDDQGGIARVLLGLPQDHDPFLFASLPHRLPPGTYQVEGDMPPKRATWNSLAWVLGTYHFSRYKDAPEREAARLVWPPSAHRDEVERVALSTKLARDLINTPANDMGPEELARAVQAVAAEHGGRARGIVGEDLIHENYPAIHAVGRASSRPPRLIDLRWGDESAPKVTLIGKGVVFDSGGLDLKSSSNMKMMKKDMGGAACILALAKMIMMAGLPIRLRVLIPAVENAVSGNAFRPLDVINTRAGLTVEIGNTDAEGRVILCDALAEAVREKPDLVVDFATLTGAARAALGTEIPALFCNDESLAADILKAGEEQADPLWRLPLWKSYRRMIDSKVADLANASDSAFAGAITAALFLEEFVGKTPWAHVDMWAWNASNRPGRPEGGEAMAIRAFFAVLAKRYPVVAG